MTGRLTLRHLRLLVALDEQATLTAAARTLGLTQPALSHQVRELERLTGAPLFQRVRRRLTFTPLARELLRSARGVVAEMDRAEASLERYRHGIEAVVRIGTRAYGLERWMPGFLAALRRDLPQVEVELRPAAGGLPLDALRRGEVDLELAHWQVPPRGLASLPLFADRLVGVVPRGHPLARRATLAAADFAGEPYVTYSTVIEPGLENDLLFEPARAWPRRFLRAGTAEAALALVAAGFGLTILSRWAVAAHPDRARLVERPLAAPGSGVVWHAVLRDDEPAESPARALAARLATWCAAEMPAWVERPRPAPGRR